MGGKDPGTAIIWSFILPGGGQIYAGAEVRGLLVFFLYAAVCMLMLLVFKAAETATVPYGLLLFAGVVLPATFVLVNVADAYGCAKRGHEEALVSAATS